MITRIECANCSDVVEVTSTSVTLPFYCNACETDAISDNISMEEMGQRYEDMAPARTFQADDVIERDATNALISDLEAQNTNLLNEVTSLKMDVETAWMWEDKSYVVVGKYKKEVERLQDELDVMGVKYARADRAIFHPWKNLWAYLWN